MTSQNEQAEELMRRVERAEERKNGEGQCLHLCIINLVIGTLYCAKGNYEFGLSRIAHALMVVEGEASNRLCADTWIHVKRCILGLLCGLAKQTIVLPSLAIQDTVNFLHACEVYGITTPSNIRDDDAYDEPTVGIEARTLRYLLMIMEYD